MTDSLILCHTTLVNHYKVDKKVRKKCGDMLKCMNMDVGDATSTKSMDVVKVGLEKQVGLELEGIQG